MASRQITGAPVRSPSCRDKVVLPLPAQPKIMIRAMIVGCSGFRWHQQPDSLLDFRSSISTPCLGFQHGFVGLGCNLVPHVPELLVEKVLHPLMQNLDRRPHRADHAAANDPLRQLEMMEAKKVYAFVEIKKTFRYIVETEVFIMPPVKIIYAEVRLAQLGMEHLTEPRTNAQPPENTPRLPPPSVAQSSANNVVVIRRNCFEHMQHGNRIIQHVVGAANQTRSIRKVAFFDVNAGAFQFPRNPLQQ